MKRFDYGWVIVATGLLMKMTALGFGRFAYAMLLSHMRSSLGFSYSRMGLLSGGILLGYLVFSVVGGVLATRFGTRNVALTSLLCSSLSMFVLSRLSGFFPLLFFTFTMGAAAAGVHIPMTALPMFWFEKDRLGRALGVIQGGTGLGILVTGFLLPPLLTTRGQEAWRTCWLLMASATFAVFLAGMILLKERPDRQEPQPLHGLKGPAAAALPAQGDQMTLGTVIFVYFIIGIAYNMYVTYFVAFMMEEVGRSAKTAGDIWAVFGWMSMVSGLIWGYYSDRVGRRRALLWNSGMISAAVLFPLVSHRPFSLVASTFLFGLTFIGIVTVVAAFVGDWAGEKRASVYGWVTLVHGVGQLIGTTSGGYLKDLTHSFGWTFTASLAGFVLCFVLIVLRGSQRTTS